MKDQYRKLTLRLFAFVFFTYSILIFLPINKLYASESFNSVLIKKVSKSYTNKFCNAIGFGLSKESAMSFSLKENKQVFENRKGFININKELLADEIAMAVVDKCGYPLKLSGEEGISEFKNYYLSKDQES